MWEWGVDVLKLWKKKKFSQTSHRLFSRVRLMRLEHNVNFTYDEFAFGATCVSRDSRSANHISADWDAHQ